MIATDSLPAVPSREFLIRAPHEAAAQLRPLTGPEEMREAIVRAAAHLIPDADVVRLEAPLAGGLSEVVRRTRGPIAVEDYLLSTAFEHSEPIDAAVRQAGLVSMMAVPLPFPGELGAVLCLGRRERRPFSHAEITLASRFAALAGSRLAAEIAVAESEQERLRLLARLEQAQESSGSIGSLLDLVNREEPPTLEAATRRLTALGDEVLVLDPAGRPRIAVTADGRTFVPSGLSAALRADLTRARRVPGEVVAGHGRTGHPSRHLLVFSGGGQVRGVLVLRRHTRPSAADLREVRRAGWALAALLMRQDAVSEARRELASELLAELLAARTGPPGIALSGRVLAAARGLRLGEPYVLVAVSLSAEFVAARPDGAVVVAEVARELDGFGGSHDGTLVALLPGGSSREAAQQVSAALDGAGAGCAVVCAGEPADPSTADLPAEFGRATHGLRLLGALGRGGVVATTADLALHQVLFDAGRASDVREFVDGVLGPLLAYDRAHKAELLRTVQVFLANGAIASRAARELGIHLNTMAKRLDRVVRVLGPNWLDEAGGLRLRLALHLFTLGDPALV